MIDEPSIHPIEGGLASFIVADRRLLCRHCRPAAVETCVCATVRCEFDLRHIARHVGCSPRSCAV